MTPAIEIKNLSKKYILNHQQQGSGYVALRDVIADKAKALKKPSSWFSKKMEQEEFWALKNIDLSIEKGDKVAIIGHNGAGKSTLLKLLSQITEPTTGEIKIHGRVTSLLEVGTGFHPELTGRENIYLNGSILGMSRAEVKRKFDEIVDFAGVEKFLDTPVKRYSSGMRMRLGFAVAAHLESEILIIDEVLAVGDAAFQKKCLGKMDDISKSEGRTILFVSHNMGAVQQLCNKGVVLNKGKVAHEGDVESALTAYLNMRSEGLSQGMIRRSDNYLKKSDIYISSYIIKDSKNNVTGEASIGETHAFEIGIEAVEAIAGLRTGITIKDSYGANTVILVDEELSIPNKKGNFIIKGSFVNYLSSGSYTVDINIKRGNDLMNKVSGLPFHVGHTLRTGKLDTQNSIIQIPNIFSITESKDNV